MGSDTQPPTPARPIARFNSRSRVGSDTESDRGLRPVSRFNSRSRVGSDRRKIRDGSRLEGFQFTLPRGERQAVANRFAKYGYVSIHAPAWGATLRNGKRSNADAFQFTLPRGERPCHSLITNAPSLFQFTLPRGERLRRRSAQEGREAFQFTLPRGERLEMAQMLIYGDLFQFTLPRGERRVLLVDRLNVSIHAPAWGATLADSAGIGVLHVSIHAPAWGATSPPTTTSAPSPSFNSRSRVGSDRRSGRFCGRRAGFNSRSRVGSDTRPPAPPKPRRRFQFTLPRGERQSVFCRFFETIEVSIHAPAWGATLVAAAHWQPTAFQFTLPRGERHSDSASIRQALYVSIHAPAWGATMP